MILVIPYLVKRTLLHIVGEPRMYFISISILRIIQDLAQTWNRSFSISWKDLLISLHNI